MGLTAKEEHEINESIAKRQSERIREVLFEIAEKGISLMGHAKPRERLRGYEANTYAPDGITLLNTNYIEQRREGTHEPLMAEQMQAAYAQQMEAHRRWLESGNDPSVLPPLEEPLMFWAKCFRLPHGIDLAEFFIRDWKKLRREEAQREERDARQPVSLGMG